MKLLIVFVAAFVLSSLTFAQTEKSEGCCSKDKQKVSMTKTQDTKVNEVEKKEVKTTTAGAVGENNTKVEKVEKKHATVHNDADCEGELGCCEDKDKDKK